MVGEVARGASASTEVPLVCDKYIYPYFTPPKSFCPSAPKQGRVWTKARQLIDGVHASGPAVVRWAQGLAVVIISWRNECR